ncbi:DUF2062 domain-containing protein [Sphingosinicella sp. CPCC 101087]|uniref:DUF2062 domain-containing protein n=1 Tax=Sphingosinicella sp. CPCC 101087 TaxID=2497754 RepID=UPI00101BD5A4|nr:DUF2062 domain-containing protein [Sphingosinicella sp. CPCC 101087]
MKDRDAILRSRWIRPFAHLFGHPSLWHLNRRSVPRALAVGLFAAFALPLGQFLLAALLAVPLRANVPLAAAATLVTNPLTFSPIYFGAYKLGSFLLHHSPGEDVDEMAQHLGAMLISASGPTALGLLVFALAAAAAGFCAGAAWWRYRLVKRWRSSRASASGGQ